MTVSNDPIVIVGMARTPMGSFLGDLRTLTAPQLGAATIQACVERAGLQSDSVDQVLFGCVLSAGIGQAPARQAALAAGLSRSTTCTTLNKMCGSGMQAAILGHDLLVANSAKVVVAGGMESMSNAPYLLAGARSGLRMGHAGAQDHMFLDGLEDAYDRGKLMGTFAEDCAQANGISREAQDAFAIRSLERAQQAISSGAFRSEIVPVQVEDGKRSRMVTEDEQPSKAQLDKIPRLKPAFREGGSVTAANASSISDGAAALVMMRQSEACARGIRTLAVIRGHAAFADAPNLYPTAPIGAIENLMTRTGWDLDDVDLFEINEAFAVVALVGMNKLEIPQDKVNVRGGACALGHPIGASGARIIVTLISTLRDKGLKRGVAAVCIGGGEATAVAIEIVES